MNGLTIFMLEIFVFMCGHCVKYQPKCGINNYSDMFIKSPPHSSIDNKSCITRNNTQGQPVMGCFTKPLFVSVSDILENVPENIQRLVIIFDDTWYGYLPLTPRPMNLTGLFRLKMLQYFEIQKKYDFSLLHSITVDGKSSSEGLLEKLTKLVINVPINDEMNTPISELLRRIPNLETIDLSGTVGIGLKGLIKVMKNLNPHTIQHMCFRNIQTLGGIGYDGNFTILKSELNSRPKFFHVKEIDFRFNYIFLLPVFVQKTFPALAFIDVSENCLNTAYGVAASFLDLLFHDTLEVIKCGNQDANRTQTNNTLYSNLDDKTKQILQQNETKFLIKCINEVFRGNISNIFTTNSTFCQVLTYLFPQAFTENICDSYETFPVIHEYLDIKCVYYIRAPIGRNIRELHLQNIHFQQTKPITFKLDGYVCLHENKLEILNINNNHAMSDSVKGSHFFNNLKGFSGINLVEWSMSQDSLRYNGSKNEHVWNPLPTLKYLDLSKNSVSFRSNSHLCKYVPNVEVINLEHTHQTRISPVFFSGCQNLRKIYLGHNNFTLDALNILDFENSKKLSLIGLQHTPIDILSDSFLSKMIKYEPLKIDLSHNLLNCNCSAKSQKFIKWMLRNSERFINFEQYQCSGQKHGQFVHNIDPSVYWNNCPKHMYDLVTVIKAIAITISIISVLIALYVCYRMRWRIKYIIFHIKERIKHLSSICKCHQDDDEWKTAWKYDAFVSYCAEDRFWVHGTLLQTLEDTYGFRLCVHYRDFEVGKDIALNILEAMSCSREVIVVLSDASIYNDWCDFEITRGIMLCQSRHKNLIVIKLGNIGAHALNQKISYVLEAYNFLEWECGNEDSHNQKLFWRMLVGTLYGESKGCCTPFGTSQFDFTPLTNEADEDLGNVRTFSFTITIHNLFMSIFYFLIY